MRLFTFSRDGSAQADHAASSGAMGVNPASLEKLISLAEAPTSDRWESLLEEVAGLFLAAEAECTDREVELYGEVLQSILPRVELASRCRLAERVAASPRTPQALLQALAEDDDRVAVPVCRRPLPLDEAILVGAVARSAMLRSVVAGRPGLSDRVVDALVRSGDAEALQALCENPAVTLSPIAASAIARHARTRPRLQQALVGRPDLPPALADEMFGWVGAEQRACLLERGDVDEWSVEAVATGAAGGQPPAPPIALGADRSAPARPARRTVPESQIRESLRRARDGRPASRHLPISKYDQKVWTGPLFIGLATLLTIMVVLAGAIHA
jgi:hypothetical protein